MNQLESQKPRRVRAKPRLVEVVRVDRLTPRMARIVFAGEELEGFTTRGPAEHLKVNFPPPGEPKLGRPDPNGRSAPTFKPHLHSATMGYGGGGTNG